MPLAHTCHGCGTSLYRVPARIDPVYGLPLVTCPACAGVVVRRKHPTRGTLRAVRLWWNSGLSLALRLAVFAGLVLGSVGMADSLREVFSHIGPGAVVAHALGLRADEVAMAQWAENDGRVWVVCATCWFALVGGVLIGGLGHIRRRWTILVGFGVACAVVVGLNVVGDYVGITTSTRDFPRAIAEFEAGCVAWGERGAALLVGLVAAPVLGWPLGRMIASMRRAGRSHGWRRKLTRARARRRLV